MRAAGAADRVAVVRRKAPAPLEAASVVVLESRVTLSQLGCDTRTHIFWKALPQAEASHKALCTQAGLARNLCELSQIVHLSQLGNPTARQLLEDGQAVGFEVPVVCVSALSGARVFERNAIVMAEIIEAGGSDSPVVALSVLLRAQNLQSRSRGEDNPRGVAYCALVDKQSRITLGCEQQVAVQPRVSNTIVQKVRSGGSHPQLAAAEAMDRRWANATGIVERTTQALAAHARARASPNIGTANGTDTQLPPPRVQLEPLSVAGDDDEPREEKEGDTSNVGGPDNRSAAAEPAADGQILPETPSASEEPGVASVLETEESDEELERLLEWELGPAIQLQSPEDPLDLDLDILMPQGQEGHYGVGYAPLGESLAENPTDMLVGMLLDEPEQDSDVRPEFEERSNADVAAALQEAEELVRTEVVGNASSADAPLGEVFSMQGDISEAHLEELLPIVAGEVVAEAEEGVDWMEDPSIDDDPAHDDVVFQLGERSSENVADAPQHTPQPPSQRQLERTVSRGGKRALPTSDGADDLTEKRLRLH